MSTVPASAPYEVRLDVDYPTQPRNRLTTFFRLILVIPILIVFSSVAFSGGVNLGGNANFRSGDRDSIERRVDDGRLPAGLGTALVVVGVVMAVAAPGFPVIALGLLGSGAGGGAALMILFRGKYPRWWFDWTRQVMAFAARITAYAYLLRDEYPSTDDEQAVHLEIDYPDVETDLSRWLVLIKGLLVLPHTLVLLILSPFVGLAGFLSWLAILVTGSQPRFLFNFILGVMRWSVRVSGYAGIYVTDRYPPFSLR